MRGFLVSIALLAISASCNGSNSAADPGPIKIVRNANLTARVGEPYQFNAEGRVQLTGRPARRFWFGTCLATMPPGYGEPPQEVGIQHDGRVTFTPTTTGKVKACIALMSDGPWRDQYEIEIDVAPRAGESASELSTQTKAFATKLIALGQATAKLKPKELAMCPTLPPQDVEVYEQEYLNWLGTRAKGTTFGSKDDYFYSPWRPSMTQAIPRALDGSSLWGGWLAERDAPAFKQVIDRKLAAVIRPSRMKMPKVVLTAYEPGEFQGWLLVGEVATGRVLCWTPLSYESSGKVGARGRDQGEALSRAMGAPKADFERNGRNAARQAIATISDTLTLTLHRDN